MQISQLCLIQSRSRSHRSQRRTAYPKLKRQIPQQARLPRAPRSSLRRVSSESSTSRARIHRLTLGFVVPTSPPRVDSSTRASLQNPMGSYTSATPRLFSSALGTPRIMGGNVTCGTTIPIPKPRRGDTSRASWRWCDGWDTNPGRSRIRAITSIGSTSWRWSLFGGIKHISATVQVRASRLRLV